MSASIFISVGEASGDIHGAELAAGLRARDADVSIFGLTGPRMAAAGVERLVDIDRLGQVGLVEVLRHLPMLKKTFEDVIREVVARRPDVCVLIDYPDFNLRLAARLKEAGLRVVFYVSPQLWAWRRGRIHGIGRRIDRMLVLFPFEVDIYRDAGIPVTFVGHPIVDTIAEQLESAAAEVETDVALLPGSRPSEVERLLPSLIATAEDLTSRRPGTSVCLIRSPTLDASAYDPVKAAAVPIELVAPDDRYGRLRRCRSAIVASGTATLELALLGVPMVVVYRVHPLTYQLAKILVSIDDFGLVNLVAGHRIVRERIQAECRSELLTGDLIDLLDDPAHRAAVLADLAVAAERLGEGGAGLRAADAVLGEVAS